MDPTGPENLRIFERPILRNVFGSVNIDNIWRMQNNMETDELVEGADIGTKNQMVGTYPKNGPSETN
jgi:hypothetical protein